MYRLLYKGSKYSVDQASSFFASNDKGLNGNIYRRKVGLYRVLSLVCT
ncbi:hypothetical protein VCR29J2_360487 [Vibrio coralliirubri]|nr:hypothetical protein VCR29J2_360487 [Vibrio coralliirubri]